MATKKIVPRANGEGAIGDNTAGAEKYWGGGFFNNINGTNAIEMAAFNDSLQWKASTTYAKGSIVFTSGLSAGMYLECLVDGTSNTEKFAIPSSIVPNTTTITDNTVTWIVRQLANTNSFLQAGERKQSFTYGSGDMASLTTLPYGWYLECTTPGETSSSQLVIETVAEGETVEDGTVVWTIRKTASTADIPAPVDISGKANVDLNNLSAAGLAKIQQYGGGIISKNLATNGYVKFENGLIIQWGTYAGLGRVTISLPISFTNTTYKVVSNMYILNATGGTYIYSANVKAKNKGSFDIFIYNTSSADTKTDWVAIGY